jgi:hypothetical protein
MLRSTGNFHPQWGYVAPAPSFLRTARIVVVASAVGATAGAAAALAVATHPATERSVMVEPSVTASSTDSSATPGSSQTGPGITAEPLVRQPTATPALPPANSDQATDVAKNEANTAVASPPLPPVPTASPVIKDPPVPSPAPAPVIAMRDTEAGATLNQAGDDAAQLSTHVTHKPRKQTRTVLRSRPDYNTGSAYSQENYPSDGQGYYPRSGYMQGYYPRLGYNEQAYPNSGYGYAPPPFYRQW